MKKEQQPEIDPNHMLVVNSKGDKKRFADLMVGDYMYILFGVRSRWRTAG